MDKYNYKQLTFAREYRKYNQSQLSSRISGLSQSNLSKYEKGIGFLSNEILLKIFDFLDFPKEFFMLKINNVIENAHFRKRASTKKSEKSEIEYNSRLLGYIIDKMAETVDFPEFTFKMFDIEDGFTPKEIAQYTRKNMGLVDEPVYDIFKLIENRGVIIYELECDIDSFDGLSFLTDAGNPVIIINKLFSNDRKRFTLAHELGHVIMHLDIKNYYPNSRNIEEEAHLFASEFLMPENYIKSSLRNLRLSDLIPLKKQWLTSMSSIIRRAKELECIDSAKYQYFNVELSRKGYKRREPITVFIDESSVFYTSFKMHKNDLGYSEDDLANAFSLPLDVIKKFSKFESNKLKFKYAS